MVHIHHGPPVVLVLVLVTSMMFDVLVVADVVSWNILLFTKIPPVATVGESMNVGDE